MKKAFVVLVLFVACVPHRDLPPDQIEKLDKLDQVMDVQATVADPQWGKIGQASYTDDDWKAFADVAARIQVTSKKIPQFTKGPEFRQARESAPRSRGGSREGCWLEGCESRVRLARRDEGDLQGVSLQVQVTVSRSGSPSFP